MANLTGFDANQIEPTSDFEPLPAGKYVAMITESELRPTKSGVGNYLQLTFEIIEGPCKGRLFGRGSISITRIPPPFRSRSVSCPRFAEPWES